MTVAAITAVLGGDVLLKRKVRSEADLRTLTRAGLPVAALPAVAGRLTMDRKALARVIGISDRTLSRRLAHAETLSAEESDRTVRLARVVAMATETFGTPEKASTWLKSPNRAIEGSIPIELLDTDAGTRTVETILGRIEWGVYS